MGYTTFGGTPFALPSCFPLTRLNSEALGTSISILLSAELVAGEKK